MVGVKGPKAHPVAPVPCAGTLPTVPGCSRAIAGPGRGGQQAQHTRGAGPACPGCSATGSGEAAHKLSENPYFWSTSTLAFSSLLPLCISSESCTLITISIITIKSECNCWSAKRSHAGGYEVTGVHGHPGGVTVLTPAPRAIPMHCPQLPRRSI